MPEWNIEKDVNKSMIWIGVFLFSVFFIFYIAHSVAPSNGEQIKRPRDIQYGKQSAQDKELDISMYRRFLVSQFPIELAGESNFQENIKGIVGSSLDDGRIFIGVAHLELDDYGYLGAYVGGKEVGGLSRSDAKDLLSGVTGEDLNKVALMTPILIMGGFMTESGRHAPYGCRLSHSNTTIMSLRNG